MKKMKLYIKYNGKEYPVDMIDFVNNRVMFRYVKDNLETDGAHVDADKYEILVKLV